MKNNNNFRDQAWNRSPAKCWVKDFILPHKYHAQIFIEDCSNLEQIKNVKSYTGSHLASCCVIFRLATVKYKQTVLQKQPLRVALKNRCSWKFKM